MTSTMKNSHKLIPNIGPNYTSSYDHISRLLKSQHSWSSLSENLNYEESAGKLLNTLSQPELSLFNKFEAIKEDHGFNVIINVFNAFVTGKYTDVDNVGFLIVLLYEILREDASRYNFLLNSIDFERKRTFNKILREMITILGDVVYADRCVALASNFLAYDDTIKSNDEIRDLVDVLLCSEGWDGKCSSTGAVIAVSNLLKVQRYRATLWNIAEVHYLIRAMMSSNKNIGPTAQNTFVSHVTESGLIQKMIQKLRETPRSEKIVRVAMCIIENTIHYEETLNVYIENDAAEILEVLPYEKWREPQLYTKIQNVSIKYAMAVRNHCNMSRYLEELNTGQLSWGYLHSDEFWAEHYEEASENGFEVIKKLVSLLGTSMDPITLAVACHDVGEFVHCHPTGRTVLHSTNAKEILLYLTNHKDRQVQRHSLMAVQKLMLDNWQLMTN